jgi:dynein assembly factor 1
MGVTVCVAPRRAGLLSAARCGGLQNVTPAPRQVLDMLKQLPQLRCLYLKGNPLVGAVPQYRRALVAALPGLTYLDDRPVFALERRCAEAWWVEG